MRGKLIVIEGTDGAGKGTQTKKLIEYLEANGQKVKTLHFPNYESPTGKIVGGPYLGHEDICEKFFTEKSDEIDPKVISLYYAADFKYNMNILSKEMDEGTNIILDRYIESNMAYQGGLIEDENERLEMYKWVENLNYNVMGVPKPDKVILLYLPFEESKKLRSTRNEALDAHEANDHHLKCAERAYLEIAKLYNFDVVNVATKDGIRTIEDIHEEVVCKYNNLVRQRSK